MESFFFRVAKLLLRTPLGRACCWRRPWSRRAIPCRRPEQRCRVIPCQNGQKSTHPLRIGYNWCYVFLTDICRAIQNIKVVSWTIPEKQRRRVVNLASGRKSDDFAKSQYLANGKPDWLANSLTSVIGGVEYDGIIQIGVTLFYSGNIYEIVKNWKWKLTNFRQELLPAPASYRILLGTNRKHKPYIFWNC